MPLWVSSSLLARIRAMPVEDDPQPDLPAVGDNSIHDLQGIESLEFRIRSLVEIDTIRHAPGIECLVTERKTNGVESEALDLVEHRFVSPGPQSMRSKIGRFKPEPVDTCYSYRLIIGIQYLVSLGVPKS